MLGPMLFATILHLTGSAHYAIVSLLSFFLIGWAIVSLVNVDEGQRMAAEEA